MFKRNFTKALTIIICLLPAVSGSANPNKPTIEKRTTNDLSSQKQGPLLFTENRGQVADAIGKPRPDILFTAHGSNTQLYLTNNSITYQFTRLTEASGATQQMGRSNPDINEKPGKKLKKETCRFTVELAGANPPTAISREAENVLTENFYLPHCPTGITGVHTYARLVYKNVYPKIDWVLYSNGTALKYDFIVHAGGDPAQIRLKISDAGSAGITEAGELLIKTALGEVREKAPVSYTGDEVIKTAFRKNNDGTIGFDVAPQPEKELRIDPAVTWSTYFGGTGSEAAFVNAGGSNIMGLTQDASGNTYIAGNSTSATGIATSGAHQSVYGGGYDVYLAKFDPSGNLLWATYYGGVGVDNLPNCAVDGSGNVYLAATTTAPSNAITTPGAHQTTIGGNSPDAFLVKFNSAGVRLWGTYYGGSQQEGAAFCATDPSGNVYLCGSTQASVSGIATTGAYMTAPATGSSPADAFLVKFDAAGNRLWGTYYGGTGQETGIRCTADNSGNVFLAGITNSTSAISSSGSHQSSYGGGTSDAFLVKFDGTGARLWATYYGGTVIEQPFFCTVDASDNIYLSGITSSAAGIATAGAHQASLGGGNDNFLAKFTPSGARLWGTYYGGSSAEAGGYCTVDNYNNVFLSGTTASTSGIALLGFQNNLAGANDAYLVKFDSTGSRKWGSYFGDAGSDLSMNCLADKQGSVYLTGSTTSATGIATNNTSQPTYGGSTDAFLVKIADIRIITDTTLTGSPFCAGAVLSIPFSLQGTLTAFSAGNVFTAQLSDATGSFNSPINIGSYTATNAGTINATIPVATATGTGYRIRVVSSLPATIGTDNKVDLPINAAVSPSVSIASASGNTVCAGTSVTYTATPVNGGTLPAYQWQKNGMNVGANAATYSDNTLTNGDQVKVILFSTAACPVPDTAVSNSLAITVNPVLTPAITITANPGNTICAGVPVTFTATPMNGGAAPSYQWQKNGINTGTNAATYSDNALANGDVISVVLTSNAICATPATATSSGIAMTVNPVAVPSVNIALNAGTTICSGTAVTFSAAAVNGGTSPIFQWKKNGINVGTNAPAYTDNTLANGDIITVTLTSNAACATPAIIVSSAVTMTVNSVLTPAVSITQSTTGIICAGTSITFTAIPVNGGATPTYRWQKNGIDIPGATANTQTDASWITGDQIKVIMTSAASCASPLAATSNTLTISVTPAPAMSGTITGNTSICPATTNVYSVATVPGATSYLWTLPTGWSGSSTTNSITVTAGTNNGIISVVASNLCGTSGNQDLSVIVNPTPSQPGTISGPQTPCTGTSATYSVAPVSGATSYNWTLPGTWSGVSTTNTITVTTGAVAGNITVASVNACGSSLPALVSVTPAGIPSQPSVITGNVRPCAGSSQIYSVVPVSGVTYNWSAPSDWIGTSATNSITYTTGTTSGTIAVTATGACGTSVAATRSITVNPVLTPSVSINAPGSICANAAATFTATPINGGASPVFQWVKNGLNAGLNTNSYADNNLNTGDVISVILTTSSDCVSAAAAASNPITVVVTPSVVPGININATTPLEICAGTPVTFFSNIVEGGTMPTYTWRKNGVIKGANNPRYTDNSLQTGDTIDVILTSNAACTSFTTVPSNKLSMIVLQPSTPQVSISVLPGTTITLGQMVTFKATAVNGGPNPTYQWMKNSQAVVSGNSADWTTNNVTSGDVITVKMTSSLVCAFPVQVISNALEMHSTATGIPQTHGDASINLYPNPNSGHFTVEVNSSLIPDGKRVYMLIVNNLGQVIYSTAVIPDAKKWSLNVVLGDEVANGIYTIRINNSQFESVKRFEIKR